MAKVIALTGARPGSWSKDRWAWQKAVWADGDLSAMARLLAGVLASGYSNHETGECRPGLKALCDAVGAHRATVLRGMAELVASGWVDRLGGEGPGKAASYRFRFPDQPERVAAPRPERVAGLRHDGSQDHDPNGSQDCTQRVADLQNPPIPPYKDKPNMNQKSVHPRVAIRGLPRPHCVTHVISTTSDRAARWDEWLKAEGYPPLAKIGFISEGGYRMPVSVAPKPSEETAYRIARNWADWLRSRA